MTKMGGFLAYKILREIWRFLNEPFNDLVRRVKTTVKEHFYERRLGICTDGQSLVRKDSTMFNDSVAYGATPYDVIEKMLDLLQLNSDDVFVDLGAGKGRVIFAVAEKRLKKIVGVEARKDMFDVAVENYSNLIVRNTPVEIVNTDVATFDVREGTVYFMFSPFGWRTLTKVLKNIRSSLIVNPRRVRVVSYRGLDIDSIDGCEWLSREENRCVLNLIIWRSGV